MNLNVPLTVLWSEFNTNALDAKISWNTHASLKIFSNCWICFLQFGSLPPGVPVHGAACPGCTGSWWLSSCGRGGPSGSHQGYQRRSGRCAWPRPGDPDSSGWCLCSSRPLMRKQNTEITVSSARALRLGLHQLIRSAVSFMLENQAFTITRLIYSADMFIPALFASASSTILTSSWRDI